jgi:hypothetical protein
LCCCCVDFGIFRPNVFSSSFCFLLLMDNRQEFIFGDPLRRGLRWRRKHTHNRTKMRDGDRCSLRVCLARKRERAQLGPFSFLFFKKKTHTKNKTFSIPHSPRTGYWINKRERRKGGLSLYFRKKKKKKYLYNHMQIGCKWWWRSAPKVIFQSLPPRALACFNSSFNLVTVHACSHLFLSLFLP